MTSGSDWERDDTLLDACLAEALGGQRCPSDLADRILALHAQRTQSAGVAAFEALPTAIPVYPPLVTGLKQGQSPVAGGPIIVPPVTPAMGTPAIGTPVVGMAVMAADSTANRSSLGAWINVLAALAAMLFVAVGLGLAVKSGWLPNEIAVREGIKSPTDDSPAKDPNSSDVALDATKPGESTTNTIPAQGENASPALAQDNQPATGAANTDGQSPTTEPGVGPELKGPVFTARSESPNLPIRSVEGIPGVTPRVKRPAGARSDAEIVAFINQEIRQGWKQAGYVASEPADDSEWARRVYLDVLGRIPTVEELAVVQADKAKERRQRLVNRLLYNKQYAEEYARHWSTLWTNTLIGRLGGTGSSLARREGLQEYLRKSLLAGAPYDQLVSQLLTASGERDQEAEKFNGAVNFLLNEIQSDVPEYQRTARASATVSRVFLGLQFNSKARSDDSASDVSQLQFWQLDAFLRQMKATTGAGAGLHDADFAGEGNTIDDAGAFYEDREGLVHIAYPVFIDGQAINRHGAVSVVNRRQELARLVIASDRLPQAAVNRLWAHFLGYGFTRPVDDIILPPQAGAPNHVPSHPALLAGLAREFAYTFDLKQLISWIVLSEPYQLSSKIAPKNAGDDPESSATPMFSRFYIRQMQAEELYNSLLVATDAPRLGDFAQQQAARTRWLEQFTTTFATDEGGEATTFNGSVGQALMMMNGEMTGRALKPAAGNMLDNVVKSDMNPTQKINYLFVAGLARKPNANELAAAQKAWQDRRGDSAEALRDIWWAVLNSNEFILNH